MLNVQTSISEEYLYILHGLCSTDIKDQIKDIWKIIEIPASLFTKLLLRCTESTVHATINLT